MESFFANQTTTQKAVAVPTGLLERALPQTSGLLEPLLSVGDGMALNTTNLILKPPYKNHPSISEGVSVLSVVVAPLERPSWCNHPSLQQILNQYSTLPLGAGVKCPT